jgi:hypothetical protein
MRLRHGDQDGRSVDTAAPYRAVADGKPRLTVPSAIQPPKRTRPYGPGALPAPDHGDAFPATG